MADLISDWRVQLPGPQPPLGGQQRQRKLRPAVRCYSARQASWLVVRLPNKLSAEDRAMLAALCQVEPEFAQISTLVQDFCELVRERDRSRLDAWLEAARQCPSQELREFARGLQRDYAAIVAALTFAWSNGPVEGHIHRLKLLKRAMHGRANFDLLRQRVLYPP